MNTGLHAFCINNLGGWSHGDHKRLVVSGQLVLKVCYGKRLKTRCVELVTLRISRIIYKPLVMGHRWMKAIFSRRWSRKSCSARLHYWLRNYSTIKSSHRLWVRNPAGTRPRVLHNKFFVAFVIFLGFFGDCVELVTPERSVYSGPIRVQYSLLSIVTYIIPWFLNGPSYGQTLATWVQFAANC